MRLGTLHTEKTKEKIRLKTLGRKHTEETKIKIGLKSLGRKPMLGKHHTQATKEKIGNTLKLKGLKSNEKNPMWKGDEVGYSALHIWIEHRLGKPKVCNKCGENNPDKRYEWSNISGEYKRDIKDWERLCAKCHRIYDRRYKDMAVEFPFSSYSHRKQNGLR